MSDLKTINELYDALKLAESRLKAANEEAEAARKDFNRLTGDLGDVLAACGMKELTMSDGRRLGLKTNYFGSAAQGRMDRIREFLAAQGSEHMIKPKKISISEDLMDKIPEELRDKIEYEINTNSLKAFLKELHNEGKLTPEACELFAVHMTYEVVLH